MNIFEQIHAAGLVYNGLNLDNLILDSKINAKLMFSSSGDIFDTNNISLINLDVTTPYLNEKTKEHLGKSTVSTFYGNLLFANIN